MKSKLSSRKKVKPQSAQPLHGCPPPLGSLTLAALLSQFQPPSSIGLSCSCVGGGRLETRSSSCLKATQSIWLGGAPNHPRSSSVTQSSPTADNVPPSQQPIYFSLASLLSPFQPPIPDHNRVEYHHGKLMDPANHPSAARSRHANGGFNVVDVDRNRLRSRQLHLLPRRPELPGRIRRQGSRERGHINRNPLQGWRCPGG